MGISFSIYIFVYHLIVVFLISIANYISTQTLKNQEVSGNEKSHAEKLRYFDILQLLLNFNFKNNKYFKFVEKKNERGRIASLK